MQRRLVFATGNPHKLAEVRQMLSGQYEIAGLSELGIGGVLPETGTTLKENALQKAMYVKSKTGLDCFAEDTGLEIDALGGEPGVFSARYAGELCDSRANIELVLKKLGSQTNRNARFRTVIALIKDGQVYFFEGTVQGIIRTTPAGSGGFGYDPVFEPAGFRVTFAEMPAADKHAISHRGQAVQKLVEFLKV